MNFCENLRQQRITQSGRAIAREWMVKDAEERNHREMRHRLEFLDDDENN
jgi:hypothetical protein